MTTDNRVNGCIGGDFFVEKGTKRRGEEEQKGKGDERGEKERRGEGDHDHDSCRHRQGHGSWVTALE